MFWPSEYSIPRSWIQESYHLWRRTRCYVMISPGMFPYRKYYFRKDRWWEASRVQPYWQPRRIDLSLMHHHHTLQLWNSFYLNTSGQKQDQFRLGVKHRQYRFLHRSWTSCCSSALIRPYPWKSQCVFPSSQPWFCKLYRHGQAPNNGHDKPWWDNLLSSYPLQLPPQ